MSGLTTDSFFFIALSKMQHEVDGRIYTTARTAEDEREDKVPYIIVTHDGLENLCDSKDDVEGHCDRVTIGVTIVAEHREALASLAQHARNSVRRCYWAAVEDEEHEAHNACPSDYTLTTSGVEYDPDKPCYSQTIYYECEVLNTMDE